MTISHVFTILVLYYIFTIFIPYLAIFRPICIFFLLEAIATMQAYALLCVGD